MKKLELKLLIILRGVQIFLHEAKVYLCMMFENTDLEKEVIKMMKVTTTRKIVTVPEMIKAIKEHYNLNDTLLSVNLNVTNQAVKSWKEGGKKPRKDSYLALVELYNGINSKEQTEETQEIIREKKPYEISYPNDGEKIYYISHFPRRIKEWNFDIYDENDKRVYDIGLYFDTKEEAEQFIREQTLIRKIKCWAKEQQGDWRSDWNNENQRKYYMGYHYEDECIYVVTNKHCDSFLKLPYFKSKEIAQACIDEFGDEILEVFC